MYGQYIQAGGEQFVHCGEVVHSSECPLSEVPPYPVLCKKGCSAPPPLPPLGETLYTDSR